MTCRRVARVGGGLLRLTFGAGLLFGTQDDLGFNFIVEISVLSFRG